MNKNSSIDPRSVLVYFITEVMNENIVLSISTLYEIYYSLIIFNNP